MAGKGMMQAPVIKIANAEKVKIKMPQSGKKKHTDKVKKGGRHPVARD